MTTTQPRQRTERATEPICPPWCDGHNDQGWQSWETNAETGRPFRYHGDQSSVLVHGVSVVLVQEEDWQHKLGDPTIEVLVDISRQDTAHLTPLQALAVAGALLDAAEAAWLAREDEQ